MNQESLEANDETVEPKRESGIFADLAVRQTSEPPRAEGRSIPPPPPTRSSILPVAKRPEEDAGMELEGFGGDEEGEPEELLDDDDDDAIKPVQVHAPSSLIRPDVASVSSSRTLPPPPPRASSPSLPGTSFPSAQASARSTSIAPGMRPVSPMVASAAVAFPETQPVAAAQPIERDMSGTYQKVEPTRPSYAAALQGPMSMPAAQAALDHVEPAYAAAPTAPAARQVPYAVLVVGALIAACFAWYMFAARTVPGVVQLTTAPADATVLFDGVPVGSVSPFLKTGVVPGVKHTLEVKKPGFRTWAQEVEVQSGQTLIFTVALPSEAGETPSLPSAPAVAEAAAPAAAPPVPAAAAPVAQVAAPAAPVAAVAANVDAPAPAAAPAQAPAPKAAVRRASAAPAAASGATGTLRVSSRPWAIVTIDGKLIGNTPQMNLTLPEGSHRVQLNNPEFNVEKVVTVKIQAGKTETLIINLL